MSGIRLAVVADHYQVCLLDEEAHDHAMRAGHAMDPSKPAGGWTHEAVAFHRVALEPHLISIGTARDDLVELVLEICSSPPRQRWNTQHIVEADLAVHSGAIHLRGCTEDPTSDRRIALDAGLYRVRISYVPSDPLWPEVADDGLGDHFCYYLDIWPPAEMASLAVLRQGPSPWAG